MADQNTDPETAAIIRKDIDTQSILLAGTAMSEAAGRLSGKFDTFAGWLLAGFGAAVALLLSSHETAALVPPRTLRIGAYLFLAAAIVTVIEKYIAIVVTAGAEAGTSGRDAFREYFKQREERGLSSEINMELFMREFFRPLMRPAVWLAMRSIRKAQAGDFNAGIRTLMILSQVQGALVLVEVGCFVSAIWQIIRVLPR